MSLKIYGNLTRELYRQWKERSDNQNKLRQNVLPMAFHDMRLFPSRSQVHEMLHCASECSHRPNADYLTFGEFCVFVSELKSCYEKRVPKPIPMSKLSGSGKISSKRDCKDGLNYEVFLGGSCNPTTWRQDIAIPMLKSLGITYYNPQVTHWGPELIELENQAKQSAEVLFFVIDNQTRSVASLIEAAHLSACNRKLILVIKRYEGPGQIILGESLSEREYLDLCRGQVMLQDIVERHEIPVFENIAVALNCTAKILRERLNVQELGLEDFVQPVQFTHVQLGDQLVKLRDTFDALDILNCGELTLRDVCMAFKILTNRELTIDNLKSIISLHKSQQLNNVMEISWDEVRVNFDQFCSIFVEFKNKRAERKSFSEIILSTLTNIIRLVITPLFSAVAFLIEWLFSSESLRPIDLSNSSINNRLKANVRDVYLGGSCDLTTWRTDIVIPKLKKNGLRYFDPQTSQWSERLIPMEVTAMENCRVLMFVITNTSRSIAAMALAANYIAIGTSIVLCIQLLPEECTIAGERLSPQAVKDYNRGRLYLSDMANRAGIPVFSNILETTNCVIQKCKQRT